MTVQRTALAISSIVFVGLLTSSGPTVRAQLGPGPTTIVATENRELRSWDATVDAMIRDGSLQLRRTDEDTLLPGRVHERLDQYYKGLRVYGGDVARQTDRGLTVSIFGNVYPDIDIDVDPTLSRRDAAAAIKADIGVDLGPSKMPELLILPENGTYRLAYRATAFSVAGSFEYFISASSGAIIRKLDAIQRDSAIGTGTGVLGDTKKMSVFLEAGAFYALDGLRPPDLVTFNMREDPVRTLNFLNGLISLGPADIATDTDNAWTDAAAVDAHAYAGWVYDYWFKRFNRRGLDNNNFRILSLIHPVPRAAAQALYSQYSAFYTNAGYLHPGVMYYGEGLPSTLTIGGQRWNYLAGALDIIGHELTHGVTAFTSGLIYQGESGALNESFSDMIGTAVEFFFQPAGTGAPMTAEYLIGEDVITPGGIRSLANPGAFGDPDHYTRRYPGTADNGGVHTNSGIGNQFYYLAIEGGVNRTSGQTVLGVGVANREQIEKTVYRAFTQMLPASATYSVARAATIQASRDLYGANSNAERAITQAWTAVGVN